MKLFDSVLLSGCMTTFDIFLLVVVLLFTIFPSSSSLIYRTIRTF